MANMSYCRFRNTTNDIADCMGAVQEGMDKAVDEGARYRDAFETFMLNLEKDSREEYYALKNMLDQAKELLELAGYEVPEKDED